MADWWTYSPSDLLLFSPRVYYRLLELHNRTLWPVQIGTVALGLAMLHALWARPAYAGRVAGGVLGLVWVWVAWSFLWERYATVNWASAYVAPLFAAQGALLLWLGARGRLDFVEVRGGLAWTAFALAAGAILAYPLLAPLMGRPPAAGEVFGIAPDPTAAATLGVLALLRRGGLGLMILPAIWCAVSSGTLDLLHAGDSFVPAAAAGAALLVRVLRAFSRPGPAAPLGPADRDS